VSDNGPMKQVLAVVCNPIHEAKLELFIYHVYLA
jgi:hypothetical protein